MVGRQTPGRTRDFFETYTRGLTSEEVQRLFTRDAREAYRFFARSIDRDALAPLPWYKRWFTHTRLFFLAFTLKLSPARRVLYGVALLMALVGLLQLFRGLEIVRVPLIVPGVRIGLPAPAWVDGTGWLLLSVLLLNLLILLEVADRLLLKDDLEIAREIQQSMLPHGALALPDLHVWGLTRPANTVGGDFYDILPQADGRIILALGDVAGKGSPAALLMALLPAILRTLVEEGLDSAELLRRLNVQICRHSPPSRFITLFYAVYDPRTGRLEYVNAGQTPPIVRRARGSFQALTGGGVALGMFEGWHYEAHVASLEPGDLLVLYSDGITEAENPAGQPFEEAGLQGVVEARADATPAMLGAAVFEAVVRHTGDPRLADDLTILVLRRSAVPIPDTRGA
jgi:phosphoserine phosphatase RsbU/P